MRPKRGQFYRHYKGVIYQVLGYAAHTETEEVLIVYKSFKDEKVWARPVSMFLENVIIEGQEVPRFKRVEI